MEAKSGGANGGGGLKESEKTVISRLATYIKEQYFKVVFLLLKEEQISLWTALTFTVVQFL